MTNFLAMKGYAGDVDEIQEVNEFLRGLLSTDIISTYDNIAYI